MGGACQDEEALPGGFRLGSRTPEFQSPVTLGKLLLPSGFSP